MWGTPSQPRTGHCSTRALPGDSDRRDETSEARCLVVPEPLRGRRCRLHLTPHGGDERRLRNVADGLHRLASGPHRADRVAVGLLNPAQRCEVPLPGGAAGGAGEQGRVIRARYSPDRGSVVGTPNELHACVIGIEAPGAKAAGAFTPRVCTLSTSRRARGLPRWGAGAFVAIEAGPKQVPGRLRGGGGGRARPRADCYNPNSPPGIPTTRRDATRFRV